MTGGLSGRGLAVHVHLLTHIETSLGEPLPLSDGDLRDTEVQRPVLRVDVG